MTAPPSPSLRRQALGNLRWGNSTRLPGTALDWGWCSELSQSIFRTASIRDLGHQRLISLAVCMSLHARRAEIYMLPNSCPWTRGGQLRPICVSSVWVKLLSYLLLPMSRADLDPRLQGNQFGVGTSEGADPMFMRSKPRSRNMWRPTRFFKLLLRPPPSDMFGGHGEVGGNSTVLVWGCF